MTVFELFLISTKIKDFKQFEEYWLSKNNLLWRSDLDKISRNALVEGLSILHFPFSKPFLLR